MGSPTAESEVLKARDPTTDSKSDEWPEFALSNATVHIPGEKDALVSLLVAAEHYPVTVVGQLEPLEDELAHLYVGPASKKRVSIEVANVRFFSYGQYSDGGVAIWAPGRAGWFTIRPSRSYKAIYENMTEAVQIFYFIADAYRNPRKTGRGRNATTLPDYSAEELFAKYANDLMPAESTSVDAAEHMYKHKDALLSFMIVGKEGISWSRNPLYGHLARKFPDALAMIKRRLKGPALRSQGSSANLQPTELADSSTHSGSLRNKGRSTRAVRRSVDTVAVDESSDGATTSQAHTVKASTKSRAPNLRRTRQNTGSHISDNTTDAPVAKISTPGKDSDSDSDRLHIKNKSSLRPKSSKAIKSTYRQRTLRLNEDDAEDSGVPSSPSAGKRKLQETPTVRRAPKRRNSKPHSDEGIDIPTSPSDGESDEAPEASTEGGPGNESTDSTKPAGSSSEQPANDPVQEDTWSCVLDGCRYKIYGASKPDSQKLIKEHYELHAFDDDERVRLVKRLQEPSLPAGHLMERVKMQAKMEGYPGSHYAGSRYPDVMPIRPGVNQKY